MNNTIIQSLKEAYYTLLQHGIQIRKIAIPINQKKQFYDEIEELHKRSMPDFTRKAKTREDKFNVVAIELPGTNKRINIQYIEND